MTNLACRIDSPTPEHDISKHVPALRAALEEQRRFRTEQLDEFANVASDANAFPVGHARDGVSEAIRTGASVALEEIDDALERLRSGRFGRCAQCEGHIPLERLEVLPTARFCMRCQHVRETRHQ